MAGFDDVIAAIRGCYDVSKMASSKGLPHFSIERCNKGVLAEWMQYNSKALLSFSKFGNEIGLMCHSRTTRFEDVHEFDRNEYEMCIETVGEQVALKADYNADKIYTLCHRLSAVDASLWYF